MARIRCFLIEPTERMQQKLRRYSHTMAENLCPQNPGKYSYHNAEVLIEEAEASALYTKEGTMLNGGSGDDWSHDDARWPTHCACGYAFSEDDPWQLFTNRIYIRTDTGEETTLRDAPPGAMWRADWMKEFHTSQDDGAPLMVKTPGGEWCVDSQANNCTVADDGRQEQHHCWPRQGEPPDVDVNKSYGPTCGAGAGSIQCGTYHGFLRAGFLEG